LITNGWFLSRYVKSLATAGLCQLIVSLDSADLAEHERNRGLDGLEDRLAKGIAQARECGLPVQASVTVSRLVRYDALPDTLRSLGFDDVAFSYPRVEPFGSTSLVYGEDSLLVDLERDELLTALDAIGRLRKRFPVLNPGASLAEVARYVRGEQQEVPCIGGYKYFYLDWNLDIWRSEAWSEPLGSVFDLDRSIPDQREPCYACMMACYRNASMLMHAAVAVTDTGRALASGQIGTAVASLFRRSVARSLWALVEETPKTRRLARRRKRTMAINDPRREGRLVNDRAEA
jgi:MoaA/NifB/PqqE/SkfB family radical SAM enzyme